MPERLTPTQRAIQERRAGGTMYGEGLPVDDDLFGVERTKERGYGYTDTGLVIERELTDEAWRGILPEIKALQTAYQLIIGDWMVYGFEQGYEVSYESMAVLTGLKPQTIEVYTSVCRNVPQLMRINSLKFNHYRLVSKLPDDEKAVWIAFAAHRQLPTRGLERLVALSQMPRLPETTDGNYLEITDSSNGDRPPLPGDVEEEATDLPLPDLPLEDEENWKALDTIQDVVKHRRYTDLTPRRRMNLHRMIGIARRAISLLEVELRRK